MESQSTDPVVSSSGPALSPPESSAPELSAAELPPAELSAAKSHQAQIRRARRKRVGDYQIQSLSRPSALKACLGSVNSGLMLIAIGLDELIEEVIHSGPRTIENIKKITPAADVLLRVTRQVERFAQLEQGSGKWHPEENKVDRMTGDMAMDPDDFLSE